MKRITKTALEAADACPEQVEIFAKEWPEGAAWTAKNLRRAQKLGLDLDWFARHFLPAPLLFKFQRQETLLLNKYYQRRLQIPEAHSYLRDKYQQQKVLILIRLLNLR